jgi:catechol 2,3-dioxygenase-like lactoylglutathione lyase family enzyme
MTKMIRIRPMLGTPDLKATIAFYTEKLGFSLDATWGEDPAEPVWCNLGRDGIALMFTAFHTHQDGDGDHGGDHDHDHAPVLSGTIYLDVDDADQMAAELADRGAKLTYGPETMAHGMRELALEDNNGYLLTFGAPAPAPAPA